MTTGTIISPCNYKVASSECGVAQQRDASTLVEIKRLVDTSDILMIA